MALPTAEGKGQLKNRDDQKALGTDRVCTQACLYTIDVLKVFISCVELHILVSIQWMYEKILLYV